MKTISHYQPVISVLSVHSLADPILEVNKADQVKENTNENIDKSVTDQ